MEDILFYGVMTLLVFVFRYTVFKDCETFDDLDIRDAINGDVRCYLRLRRFRVKVGVWLLLICGWRWIFSAILAPVINPVLKLCESDYYLSFELVTQRELYILGVVCAVLLVIHFIENRIMQKLMREFPEEE